MKIGFQHLLCLGLPFLFCACGSDIPSFVEKPEAIITFTVDKNAIDEDSFDMDELMADDELSADASDAGVTYASSFEDEDTGYEDAAMDDNNEDSKAKDPPQKAKKTATASNNISTQSADATPITNTPDSGSTTATSGSIASTGSTGSSPSIPDSGNDDKAVAKACLPHFRGLSQKIKVVDASGLARLNVAPGTVIAFKLTGNYSRLNINLPAGNDMPGVCFFVSGNHADVKFSTASQMEGFAYIAAGNQSVGAIEFLGGSPARSHIALKGNQPTLNILGLDASLCQSAKLSGNAPRFQCNP